MRREFPGNPPDHARNTLGGKPEIGYPGIDHFDAFFDRARLAGIRVRQKKSVL
jgi:hypothetical protein